MDSIRCGTPSSFLYTVSDGSIWDLDTFVLMNGVRLVFISNQRETIDHFTTLQTSTVVLRKKDLSARYLIIGHLFDVQMTGIEYFHSWITIIIRSKCRIDLCLVQERIVLRIATGWSTDDMSWSTGISVRFIRRSIEYGPVVHWPKPRSKNERWCASYLCLCIPFVRMFMGPQL